MKNNLPNFLLCKNEAALPGAAFILQTNPPLIFGQVIEFESSEDLEDFIRTKKNLTAYGHPYGHNVIIAYAGLLSSFSFGDGQATSDKLASVMRRMSDWYLFNYLKTNV